MRSPMVPEIALWDACKPRNNVFPKAWHTLPTNKHTKKNKRAERHYDMLLINQSKNGISHSGSLSHDAEWFLKCCIRVAVCSLHMLSHWSERRENVWNEDTTTRILNSNDSAEWVLFTRPTTCIGLPGWRGGLFIPRMKRRFPDSDSVDSSKYVHSSLHSSHCFTPIRVARECAKCRDDYQYFRANNPFFHSSRSLFTLTGKRVRVMKRLILHPDSPNFEL